MKRLRILAYALVGTLLIGIQPLGAQQISLKAVSAWPENNVFSEVFLKFIEKVNADGKGVIQIQFLGGGAKVMPPFEVGNAVRNGVIDIGHVASGFYANLLPEADMLTVSNIPASEWRKNGALQLIQQVWAQKMSTLR